MIEYTQLRACINLDQLRDCLDVAGLTTVTLFAEESKEQKPDSPYGIPVVVQDGIWTIWVNRIWMYYGDTGPAGYVYSACIQQGNGSIITLIDTWSETILLKTIVFYLLERRINKAMEIPEKYSIFHRGF